MFHSITSPMHGVKFFAAAKSVEDETCAVEKERRLMFRSVCTCGECDTPQDEAMMKLAERLACSEVKGHA